VVAKWDKIYNMSISSNRSEVRHYVKFTTSEWGKDEFCFDIKPLYPTYKETALDHHIQVEIVQWLKAHNLDKKDKKFIYYDENMKEIMHNDDALNHCKYEYPDNKDLK